MTFEEASDMYAMNSISPQLTCQCDELHICQQCHEDSKIEMKRIIKEYYLAEGSKLVKYQIGTNGVDCWFDANDVRQHRCLSFVDFVTL